MKKRIVDFMHRLGYKKLLKEETYYDENYEGSRNNLIRVVKHYSNYSASCDYYIGDGTVWYSYPNFRRFGTEIENRLCGLEEQLMFKVASAEKSGDEFKCITWEHCWYDESNFWEQYKFWKETDHA